MTEEVKYNNTLVSGRADETLTYTKYVKDESSGKSTKELLDEKVNKTDQLGTTQIADKAVTNEKLAEHSVDNSKLSPDSVSYDKIQNDAVITEKIQDNAVTTEKVKEKAITNTKLGDQSVDGRVVREASLETKHFANESVTAEKVARKSITKDKLADNAVDASQVVDGSIGNAKLSSDSVTTEKIKDSSVTNEKVADNTLGIEKFDPELRKTIQAATGLPDDLSQMIQDVDKSVKKLKENDTDLQSQINDKQQQITANKSAQDTKNASLDENMKKLNTRDDQITETLKNISTTGGASVASAVTYDNTTSQLTSANIQGAVDELQGAKIDKTSILQESGEAEDKVMSQKAVSAKFRNLSSIIENTGLKFKIAFINVNTGEELQNTTRFISDFIEISNKPFVLAFDENNNIVGVSYFYYNQSKNYLGTNYTPSSKYVRFSVNKDTHLSYELISKYHIFLNNKLVHNFTKYGLVTSAGIKHDGFYTLDNTKTIEDALNNSVYIEPKESMVTKRLSEFCEFSKFYLVSNNLVSEYESEKWKSSNFVPIRFVDFIYNTWVDNKLPILYFSEKKLDSYVGGESEANGNVICKASIPSEAKYFVIQCLANNIDNGYIIYNQDINVQLMYKKSRLNPIVYPENISLGLLGNLYDYIKNDASNKIVEYKEVNLSQLLTSQTYIDIVNGEYKESAGSTWLSSPLLKISNILQLKTKVWGSGSQNRPPIVFLDKNGNYVGRNKDFGNNLIDIDLSKEVVPTTAVFCRLQCIANLASNYKLTLRYIEHRYDSNTNSLTVYPWENGGQVITDYIRKYNRINVFGYKNRINLYTPIILISNTYLNINDGVELFAPNSIKTLMCNASAFVSDKSTLTYDNEENIKVFGGIWNVNSKVTQILKGLRGCIDFVGVKKLFLSNMEIRNANEFAIQINTAMDLHISNIYLKDAKSDGIHLGGDIERFEINNIFGSTEDDMIALNAWDWMISSPHYGTIKNGSIHDIFSNNATEFVRILGKSNDTNDYTVKDVCISNIFGQASLNCISFDDSTSGKDNAEDIYKTTCAENIAFKNINVKKNSKYPGQSLIRIQMKTKNVVFDNCTFSSEKNTDNAINVYDSGVLNATFKNCKFFDINDVFNLSATKPSNIKSVYNSYDQLGYVANGNNSSVVTSFLDDILSDNKSNGNVVWNER